jgi:HrpA-like RNA helicase
LKRHRDNPHWEKNRAQVVAVERGTLYGLPVYTNRRVHYGPLDPKLSRDLFIRSALVEGEFDTRAPFFAHNRRLVHEIERLEHKQRRPDILVDDELIRAFYDERIPEGIHNGADFERWRKEAEPSNPKLLYLKREDLMRHEAAGITTDNFPHALRLGANEFKLEYHFDPPLAARRRDTHRAGRAPQPGAGVTLRVAGAGAAQGEGARAGEVHAAAAEEQARAARRIRRSVRGGDAALGHATRAGARAPHSQGAQPRSAA